MFRTTLFIGMTLLGAAATAVAADPAPATKASPLLQKPLTGIAGKEGLMLEVTIPPGGGSPAHRHDADVFVYVLEGAVIMQVAGGEPQTLGVGQTFYENPADVHVRSENASKTEPARLLVFFVKNSGAAATRPAAAGK
ncbi:MAG TPA: cupin domain-containing protein [Steroidobacteraceae bacterium]|jgi:quercetin dioxygenase-like cupin family protein|nr:cupin domain-containing protein [Steroidobacteraceae bacterium]